jgi:outer membrane protein assembly factor BamB
MNAINAQTGEVIWQLDTGHNIETAPLVDNEGNVYFFYGIPGEIHYVISATKDGEIRWKFTHKELYTLAYHSGMHMDKDGNIYFCSGDELYSLDYDGNLRWKTPFVSGRNPVSPILGDSNGNIYLGLSTEYLLAYEQDGNKKFRCTIPEGGFITLGALSNNGRLYLVGAKTLYCIK